MEPLLGLTWPFSSKGMKVDMYPSMELASPQGTQPSTNLDPEIVGQ